MKFSAPHRIKSIAALYRRLGKPAPHHPLVSVERFTTADTNRLEACSPFVLDFYCIAVKQNVHGKLRYGQQHYDYDEGVMLYTSPGQVMYHTAETAARSEGICLSVHPEFLKGYGLARTIHDYGFFAYDVNEALHLSEAEEDRLLRIMEDISKEHRGNFDKTTHDVIIAQIELLLQYSNRYYQRQFMTRKSENEDVLLRLEAILKELLQQPDGMRDTLVTVREVARRLNLSPDYLSDLLRSFTGLNTQQYIHEKLVDRAKVMLATTDMSVGEIAYQLGFQHPQSLSRLFKRKTQRTPQSYRRSVK